MRRENTTHSSLTDARRSLVSGIRFGDSRQERFGLGVFGVGKQFMRWRQLDQLADIHHGHTVGNMGDDAEIMRMLRGACFNF